MRGSKRSPNSPHTKKGSPNHRDFFRVPTNMEWRHQVLDSLDLDFWSSMVAFLLLSASFWLISHPIWLQYLSSVLSIGNTLHLLFVCSNPQHLLIAAEYLALSTLDAWQLFPLTVPSSVGPLPSTPLVMRHAMVCNNLRRLLRTRQTTETTGMVDDGPSTQPRFLKQWHAVTENMLERKWSNKKH